MAPNLRDQLPIIKALVKWFSPGNSLVVDSLIFRLHHQATSFMILVGFVFVVVENYLDHKAIMCHTKGTLDKFAHGFCWMHGTAYVRHHLQGQATGCYVDQSKLKTPEDALITSYYLWLPYLLSLLFALAKLPHSMWKRFFENNLINSIIGGVGGEEKDDRLEDEEKAGAGEGGGEVEEGEGGGQAPAQGNNKGGGGKNNQNQKGGQNQNQKGKNKGGQQKQQQQPKTSAKIIASSFMEFDYKYAGYQRTFSLLETLNILTLLVSVQITHWILNYKFWNYGNEVINYLTVYGSHLSRGKRIHDPMCELFPTEVSCNINVGSPTGSLDRSNFLCILQNNLFNQKYFFVLWVWWMLVLALSCVGLVYRLGRLLCAPFSRYMVSRRCHGFDLGGLEVSSAECFVLEMVIENLHQDPVKIKQLLEEVTRTWKRRTKLQMEEQRRRPRGRGKDRVADVEDGLVGLGDGPPKYPALQPGKLSAPAQPGNYYANLSTAANTPANGKPT